MCLYSGHDHIYERLVPQHGIAYFVSGNSGLGRTWGYATSAPERSADSASRYDGGL
jgi:hypothetical protein